jgi:hypothetical protein
MKQGEFLARRGISEIAPAFIKPSGPNADVVLYRAIESGKQLTKILAEYERAGEYEFERWPALALLITPDGIFVVPDEFAQFCLRETRRFACSTNIDAKVAALHGYSHRRAMGDSKKDAVYGQTVPLSVWIRDNNNNEGLKSQ